MPLSGFNVSTYSPGSPAQAPVPGGAPGCITLPKTTSETIRVQSAFGQSYWKRAQKRKKTITPEASDFLRAHCDKSQTAFCAEDGGDKSSPEQSKVVQLKACVLRAILQLCL